jgi:hypothetical protein
MKAFRAVVPAKAGTQYSYDDIAKQSANRAGSVYWVPANVFGPGGLLSTWLGAKYPRHLRRVIL